MSLDRYTPIRLLGEGSFGKVYVMRDSQKSSLVCMKVIKIKNIPKKEREATRMEVDLLKRLRHPNIVRYIDSFLSRNSESLCICMEFCDGGDLANQIKSAKRSLFSEEKILHWFVQLALGLHYMHGNRVLHRDLKTQNVFLLGNGRLVLGDLGISKVLDKTVDFAQTCIGTPYYMSPEIFKNKPYDYKSDVWALGCVLYEMTTLNHAFDAASLNGLATKIVKGKYPPADARYSRHLRELIAQMLMLNPAQRPDLDNILRKPFIKRHVVNFFVDIVNRPGTIGEGTLIMRQAVVGGGIMNDHNMLALRQQLEQLGMTDAVNEALRPKAAPQDDQEAIRQARDQASALKREQEHKRMVEEALEKLRQEREQRTRMRAQPRGAAMSSNRKAPVRGVAPPSSRYGSEAANHRYGVPDRTPGLSREPSVASVASHAGVRDRGINWGARPSPSAAAQAQEDVNRRHSEERERIERERRSLAQKQQQQQQRQLEEAHREEARQREETRQREEARQRLRQQEEDRARLHNAERERAAKQAAAQQQAKYNDAAINMARQQENDRQRQKQKEEMERLRRDKVDLDLRLERKRMLDAARVDRSRAEGLDQLSNKLNNLQEDVSRLSIRPGGRQAAPEPSRYEGPSVQSRDVQREQRSKYMDDYSGRGSETDSRATPRAMAPKFSAMAAEDDSESDEDVLDAAEDNVDEGEQELLQREEALRQELTVADMRCEELQRTLNQTKSYLGPRGVVDEDEDTASDDDFTENDTNASSTGGLDATVRVHTTPNSGGNLQVRMESMRRQCIEALGNHAFNEACDLMRNFERNNQHDYDDIVVSEQLRNILGEGKQNFNMIIQQLILMEIANN